MKLLNYRVLIVVIVMISFGILAPDKSGATLPLVSDDAGLVGKNTLQLELANEYSHSRLNALTHKENELSAAFTFGVLKHLDAVLSIPYSYRSSIQSGFNTTEQEFAGIFTEWKWQFYNRGHFSLALKPTLGFPTGIVQGNDNLENIETNVYLLGSFEAPRVLFHGDIGYYAVMHSKHAESPWWHMSFANEYMINHAWRIVSNIITEFGANLKGINEEWSILGGLVYTASEHCDVDLGLEHTFKSAGKNVSLHLGTTMAF